MKKIFCPKCETEKTADMFFRDKTKSSGYKSHCKACRKEYADRYRLTKHHRDTYNAYMRRDLPRKKKAARTLVAKKLRRGTMERLPCRFCGSPEGHAHHMDYDRPYDVVFLCPDHHAALHGFLGW